MTTLILILSASALVGITYGIWYTHNIGKQVDRIINDINKERQNEKENKP